MSEWTGSKQLNELVGGDQQAGSLELWGGIGLERLKSTSLVWRLNSVEKTSVSM